MVRNGSNEETIKLDGGDISLTFRSGGPPRIRLQGGNDWFGGNGDDGDLVLFASTADNQTLGQATIHLDGGACDVHIGGNISIIAADGTNKIGGNSDDVDLVIFKADGDNQTLNTASIHLNESAGDITLHNADCAEEFDIAEAVEPGTFRVIDSQGDRLRPSTRAYDRGVAGVVSGTGGYRPGIVLDRQPGTHGRMALALAGKVYCKVDARHGAIGVGDLLTTSPTPRHAMNAGDPMKAFGAVIGKAVQPLADDTGLVPMLVGLQ